MASCRGPWRIDFHVVGGERDRLQRPVGRSARRRGPRTRSTSRSPTAVIRPTLLRPPAGCSANGARRSNRAAAMGSRGRTRVTTVHPDDLDTGATGDLSWQFSAGDLPNDGCYRWAVSLVDSSGDRGDLDVRHGARGRHAAAAAPACQRHGVPRLAVQRQRHGLGARRFGAPGADRARPGPGLRHRPDPFRRPVADPRVDLCPGHRHGQPATRTLALVLGCARDPRPWMCRARDAVGLDGAGRHVTISVDRTGAIRGDLEPAAGFRIDLLEPGAALAARDRQRFRMRRRPSSSQRQRAKVTHTNSCSGLHWSNDGAAEAMSRPAEATGLRSGYCYRWRITSLDRVGNRGPTRTSGTILYDGSPPRGDFITADEGTSHTQAGSTYRLRWTESERGGSGGLTRVLERERKTRAADGTCSSRLWRLDGSDPLGAFRLRRHRTCRRLLLPLAARPPGSRRQRDDGHLGHHQAPPVGTSVSRPGCLLSSSAVSATGLVRIELALTPARTVGHVRPGEPELGQAGDAQRRGPACPAARPAPRARRVGRPRHPGPPAADRPSRSARDRSNRALSLTWLRCWHAPSRRGSPRMRPRGLMGSRAPIGAARPCTAPSPALARQMPDSSAAYAMWPRAATAAVPLGSGMPRQQTRAARTEDHPGRAHRSGHSPPSMSTPPAVASGHPGHWLR